MFFAGCYHPIEFIKRNDSNSPRGSVGIYVKEKFQFKERTDLSIFIPHIFESLCIEILLNDKNILIGTIIDQTHILRQI